MFRAISEVAEALRGLRKEARTIGQTLEEWPQPAPQEPPDLSGITERIDKIELHYAKWEAQAEANLLKADALFKNARNAEERTRASTKKANETLESSVEGEEAIRLAYASLYGVPPLDANGGENGELSALRSGLELDAGTPKNRRLKAKFG